jgi:DNA-binding protein H-NS
MNWTMATLNEVSAKLLEVDAKQDQEIALLKHRVEQLEGEDDNEMIKELRERVRKLEKWVAGAAAVIAAATFVIGIAVAVDSKEIDYGSNGSTEQKILLQLPGDRD